ncbi:hypothetical protein niasHT_031919 [Heterodera trifolii]|uniref:Uncharacterized protein n=1 Tax=Heterodera trifolii TaxID=157864 RepID=A0ABD2HT50_9BILA
MPNTLNILLIVLFAVVSFCLSASTGGKKTATDGSGSNSSAGIGTKLKRIVTAGLLFTSLATGGAEAIGRRNAQGGNAAGLVPSHVTNRSMVYELLGTANMCQVNMILLQFTLPGSTTSGKY